MAGYITLEHLRRAVAALVEKIQDKVSVEDINIEDVYPYSMDANDNYVIGNIVGKDIKISSDWVNEVVPAPITYSSLPANLNGTSVSLVTTGDKYNWNNMVDIADIPIGYVRNNTLYIREPHTYSVSSSDYSGNFYFLVPPTSAGASTMIRAIKWKQSDGTYFTYRNNIQWTLPQPGLYRASWRDGLWEQSMIATQNDITTAINNMDLSAYATTASVSSNYVPQTFTGSNVKQYIKYSYITSSNSWKAITYLGPNDSGATATKPGGIKISNVYANSANKTSVEISAQNDSVYIYNLPTPTLNDMAANKKYVDDAISGINTTIGNLTAADVGATTSSDVSSMISSAVGGIHSFEVSVVSSLPTTNIDTHTIYYVRNNSSGSNIYDEYMYINSAWENIGSTQVDLSGYAPLASPAFTTQISIGNATMTASQLSTLFTSPTFSNQITIGSSTLTSSQLSTLFSSPTFSTQITIGSTTLTESQLSTLISFVSGLQAAAGVSF